MKAPSTGQKTSRAVVYLFVALIGLSLLPILKLDWTPREYEVEKSSISRVAFEAGLVQCSRIKDIGNSTGKRVERSDTTSTRKRENPRIHVGKEGLPPKVLIVNATLWNGDGSVTHQAYIEMIDGIIAKVGANLDLSVKDTSAFGEIIYANGLYVTPGLVDMHSHAGLDSWPETEGGADTNEMSGSPVHPELKSLDGFDPTDIGIDVINSGGVTSSLILPGSGNIMGGEAFAFKMRKLKSNRAEEMLLMANENRNESVFPRRWMKMACGENAIWNGRSKGLLPESRLGEAFLFRERIEAARQAMQAQDEWCFKAESPAGFSAVTSLFPDPIEHESLVALLRGEILLNVHCYETYDLEMMVRLSKEFGFKIAAFHHALEAWQVADLLAAEGIGAAIFADHWGYKKEAYDASVNGAKVLAEAGVKVAFKSDHPVLNAQNLIFESAKAVGYGFPQHLAIQAVTSTPASLMGQDHRIGHVLPFFDADLVIWDKNPLELGAHPLKVFVDGYSTFEHVEFSKAVAKDILHPPTTIHAPIHGPTLNASSKKVVTYHNIKFLIDGPAAAPTNGNKLVVEDGVLTCMGSKCTEKGDLVDLKQGWVVPGLIASNVHLGLEEISQEKDTSAGSLMQDSGKTIFSSATGIQVGQKYSKMLRAAFKAGVTTAISSLRFEGAVGALGVAFRVGVTDMNDDPIISANAGYNFAVGNRAKSNAASSSVPGQIEQIRFTIEGKASPLVVVDVESSSYIRSIIKYGGIDPRKNRFVCVGGAEAHGAAELLASVNASVILSDARCTPHSWFTRDCLVAGSSPSAFELLKTAGVNVGLSVREDNFIRGLIWEAGWRVADLIGFENMSDFERAKEAVALLTWNIAKAYQLEKEIGVISVGRRATFVVFDGNGVPGTLETKVRLVVDGKYSDSNTEQF